MTNYRIGLDIGIGSVGYSILENNPETEEPMHIIKMGVRTFSPNEKDGESTAKDRREKRGIRRRKRRKQFRVERVYNLFLQCFGQGIFSEIEILNKGNKQNGLKPCDVYKLRFEALERKLTDAELAKVLLNLLKHRGFRSNRKNLKNSKEDGNLLSAIQANKILMQEKGYRTIGEMLYKDSAYKILSCGRLIYNIRNHNGEYKNSFLRDDLLLEIKLIFEKQKEFGNTKLTNEFTDRFIFIFDKQRNFDEGPGEQSPYSAKYEIGKCTFLKSEDRAPKATYTFELFGAISKINNLKVDGDELSQEQKQVLIDKIKETKELTFTQIRNILNIDKNKFFNLCNYRLSKKEENLSYEEYNKKCEDKKFLSMSNSYQIRKALGLTSSYENRQIIDEVALLLCLCKSDVTIDEYIKNNIFLNKLSSNQIENIKVLNFSKFGSLSIKAMQQIEPFLLQGQRYDIACKNAGFNHSCFECEKLKYLKGAEIEDCLSDVTNNVVKRSVNQTLRVLNEIIKQYGSPQFISIELARELGKSKNDRRIIEINQKNRFLDNKNVEEILIKDFNFLKPTGQDILKYKLYCEQDGKCMYSGKPIDVARLFEPNYLQIDHILPFSKSMNDSYNNKVLVIADENQNKGDRTPFEYFGSDEEKWAKYVARVSLIKNKEKKNNLLKKHILENEQKEFISRNLNDTRYMSKLLLEIFRKYLLMSPIKNNENGRRKNIFSVNGAVTNYIRKCWGINKFRDDGDIHHAIDASIIATVDDGMVRKITEFNKFKEIFIKHDNNFVNRVTGEILTSVEKQEYEKQNIDTLSGRLPIPYEHFLNELAIRSSVKYYPQEFTKDEKLELYKMGYSDEELNSIKPVFISRMKTVKKTGAIHKETIMSAREYNKTGKLIKTVPITSLKYTQKPEPLILKDDKYPNYTIEDYYNPQDDRLLYLKLKEYLVEHENKIPESLNFYKPRKDGTDGPRVKKVKKYVKETSCVITPNGAASNDTMFRVDVFEKGGKFYLCPIYMVDVYKHKLPNKLIAIKKDWIKIDKTYNFKFSLYQNDLVKVTSKREITLNKNFDNPKSKKPEKIESKEFLLYYNSTNISVASIRLITHDNCYIATGIGIKNLVNIEKFYVDIMGKIYKAPKEERTPI